MSSVAGRDSSGERLDVDDSFVRQARQCRRNGPSQVWLDGEVLACACPDCGAPMSIRLWLALAECRMCGAQVELTEEQERQARELLESREAAPSAPPSNEPWSQPVRPAEQRPDLKPLPILGAPHTASRRRVRTAPQEMPPLIAEPVIEVPAVIRPTVPQAPPLPRLQRQSHVPWIHLIAALASLLVNMLVIILLGLIMLPTLQRPDVVIIEASIAADDGGPKGGEIVVRTTTAEAAGKNPISPTVAKPAVAPLPQERTLPPADLADLRMKVEESALPNLPLLAAAGAGSPTAGTLLAGRDPRVRTRVLNIEGGNERSEIAVAMGLRWIAKHQNDDGSWSLNQFSEAGGCRGQCKDIGVPCDTAATGLALLPFLGAGFTHRVDGEYRETVEKGLAWLVRVQGEDGSLMGSPVYGNTGMYAHGQATMALCEAVALTQDSKLRIPAQKAVDFIVAAQHSQGGWRYFPGQPGDTSVVGWQLMALRSAQMAKLHVPDEVFERSDGFLASVQKSKSEALFGYMPQSRATEAMTAEGLLCRLYSGWRADAPPLLRGADWLLRGFLPRAENPNMYYWYYATQTMHHLGGERWTKWNERMRPLLIEIQEKEGHELGSWTPTDMHDVTGGRLYMTALAVCTLEVYYRHLPIYRNEALVGRKSGDSPSTPPEPSESSEVQAPAPTGSAPRRALRDLK